MPFSIASQARRTNPEARRRGHHPPRPGPRRRSWGRVWKTARPSKWIPRAWKTSTPVSSSCCVRCARRSPALVLRQSVGGFPRRGGPLRPAARAARRAGGAVKTIMTVDDSASLRQMVSLVLRGGGYEVIEATDGVDALSKLNGQEVHLFLTDINMPKMDGLEFTRQASGHAAIQVRPHRSVDHGIASGEETGR